MKYKVVELNPGQYTIKYKTFLGTWLNTHRYFFNLNEVDGIIEDIREELKYPRTISIGEL